MGAVITYYNKIEEQHHLKGILRKQSNKHQNSQKTLLKAHKTYNFFCLPFVIFSINYNVWSIAFVVYFLNNAPFQFCCNTMLVLICIKNKTYRCN